MILKETRSGASAAIGEIIKLGGKLISPEVQLHLQNHHLPFVIQHMPSLHFRVQKCYALALTAAELVSCMTVINTKYIATVQGSMYILADMCTTIIACIYYTFAA